MLGDLPQNNQNNLPLVYFRFPGATQITDFPYNIWNPANFTEAYYTTYIQANVNAEPTLRDIMRNCYYKNFEFEIYNTSNDNIVLSGMWCTLFGLSPVEPNTLPANGYLKVKIPIYGHDYVMISCNIVSDTLSSLVSTNLEQTSLLAMVPTPNNPGELVAYSPGSTGRLEVVQPTLDNMELSFTDRWGLPVYGLKDFALVLDIDFVVPVPKPPEERHRLDLVREELMNQTRKRLREQYR